ncbi:GTPase-activating protein gyp8, partial [Spiromyces aspiralis]
MGESLEPTLLQIATLFTLLRYEDPQLYKFLTRLEIPPYFAISWVITWFAHDLDSLDNIARIFDFCIATSPLAPLYISAALTLENRDSIMRCEPEFAQVHTKLAALPQSISASDWQERILVRASGLMQCYPPPLLQYLSQAGLSVYSVVNTYNETQSMLRDRVEPVDIDELLPTA